VIEELQSTHPDRLIEAQLDLPHAVVADTSRIGQLLSNLLANALLYGAENEPIRVKATTNEKFELSVCNKGKPIPAAAIERLFQPFSRGGARPSQQGLGLGLFIAAEIARAHGGKLDVSSTIEETCFTFSMPHDGVASS
jgi:signal transduction histidine kinase